MTYVPPITVETIEESASRPHEKNKVSDGGKMTVSMVDSIIHNEKDNRPFEDGKGMSG
jgi:hypothetical protein